VRGLGLMRPNSDRPKCYAEIDGRRLLDWGVRSFSEAGIENIAFIGGYQIEKVRRDYPQFTFRNNKDWERNNILASLMCAEDLMSEGFICCYSDTLFTSDVVKGVTAAPGDIVLSVDVDWLARYEHRTEHPPNDAEKVTVKNGHVTRIHRDIPPQLAYGEYTGIAKFGPQGAARLVRAYHQAKELYAGKPFREAVSFEKANLILLL